jgi:hypothetical protein
MCTSKIMPDCKGKKVAVKTSPKLWASLKDKIHKGSKGGPSGKWSARKSQLLVAAYKKSGGKFKGSKSKCNSLTKWSKEDWNYIGGKGSNPKKHKGRYLPRAVREKLSPKQKALENRRKGSKRGQNVKYSPAVVKLMHKSKIL